MKLCQKYAVAAVSLALSLVIVLPVVFLAMEEDAKPGKLVAYAALEQRLDTLGGSAVQKSSYADTIAEAERKKKEYEEQKKRLEAELAAMQSDYDDILAYVEEMDQKQNQIMLDMLAIEDDLKQLNREYEQIQADLEEAEAIAAEQYETMKKRLQYIYENGSTTYLQMIFDAKSLTDLLNQVEYVEKITEYDNNLLNRYLESKQQIADYKVYLEAKIEAVNKTQEMYQADYEFAQEVIAKKQTALADYEAKMGLNEELLEDYIDKINKQEMTVEEAKKAAEEEIRKAEEEAKKNQQTSGGDKDYSDVPNTGYDNAANIPKLDVTDPSKMIWPLPGDGRVGDGFGPRIPPIEGASSFHKGVDIGGNYGAQIVASLAGTVYEAGWNSTGGYHVYIDHGNGYITRYLHLSKILCNTGDYVLQGEVIGLVGSTGVSTAPHLHFSVYKNGTAVDPMNYIKY
ncbi:MAG: peptidoglycan DD-metalloendopeptidase family protein [Lachnospiraceae bacterium]|nr:peptidoglycan DD-metalloendopeptidase family protein [Lachnospiraceae bacterium]